MTMLKRRPFAERAKDEREGVADKEAYTVGFSRMHWVNIYRRW